MAEPTNPPTGVEPQQSVEDRLTAFLGREEEPREPQAEPSPDATGAPEGQPPETDAPTVDDLPPETPEPAGDVFEIVHNGQQHKLSREDTIRYAQQGFDYTQKTQALAQHSRALQQREQQLAQIEQVQPHLLEAAANVRAIGAQLQRYANVDWVQLATNDPLEYPKQRAVFDQLQNAYGAAQAQFGQLASAVGAQKAQLSQQQLTQEWGTLLQRMPEWSDQKKYAAGVKDVTDFLRNLGATDGDLSVVNNSSLAVQVTYMAAQYAKLLASKADKSKLLQNAPPMTRPGAASSTANARADKTADAAKRLRKTGDVKDAAALLLARMGDRL